MLKDTLVVGLEDCERDSFTQGLEAGLCEVSTSQKNSLTPRVLSNPQLIRITRTSLEQTTQ